MPATPAWLAAVEGLLNRNIGAQARSASLARRLDGKSLQVDLEGVVRVRAVCSGGRLTLASAADGDADAVISGPPGALLRMLTAEQARPLGRGSLQVRGDAEVAASYRELLRLSRPDLEEEAARIVGDAAAHRLGAFGRRALSWMRHAGRTFGQNVAEYLQEESRDVAGRMEVEEFVRGVDDLREAVDRAQARLERAERRLGGAGSKRG
ncbi:MAG: SCP2 sterol-binding domain-containing protein [Gammaproteobacteria bacterium]|nr:SCP2 sterol-binding domain-containing protein [Gammaproteobacteria bacterium]MDE2347473.1 SCP2 sterol-binding domain-containing protein [Gammaproteobacteria bacterium]